jgi:4-aminobutyrate aminotransferase/diaminobutyrate-pyruvate transaminase/4-aminobutyrate aminotransferase/(S)-3-amino-2-methylpropionate transaminase
MAGKYSLTPQATERVETAHRRIVTPLPVPESLPMLEALMADEPVSMQGQPPVIWAQAEGCTVADAWGNRWLDWSSGVLITNAGHGHPHMRAALRAAVDAPLLATYCFPHAGRARLARLLVERAPEPLKKVFLLSTGAEAVENTLKLARTWGRRIDPAKRIIVSFRNAFHGRTLGAQLAGGMPRLKQWIGDLDPSFVQVPFPDGFKNPDTRWARFTESLAEQGVDPAQVCAVISETYQGVGPDFMPVEYARELRTWCDRHGALLIFDEVQAGFGRTGRPWGFEHYGIVPDLVACGKGLSGAMPVAAVLGRPEVMDLYPPGAMTSTHSANPVCVAGAIACLEIIDQENLVANSARLGTLLYEGLLPIQRRHAKVLGHVCGGRGLVAGVLTVKPGTREPDPELALRINEACFRRGLLMFAPVGVGGECLKISPPLCITEDALREGLAVFAEACDACCGTA